MGDMTKINISRAFHASKAKNPILHTASEYEEYFERKEWEAKQRAKQRQDRRAYALAKGSPTEEEDRNRILKNIAATAMTKAIKKKTPITLPRLACLEKSIDD